MRPSTLGNGMTLRGIFCASAMTGMLLGSIAIAGVPFAVKKAPKDADWLCPERWKDVSFEELPAVQLTDCGSYINLPVSGDVPADGNVVMKIKYYNFDGLKPFSFGIGGWGSPVKKAELEGSGWQVAELQFPAAAAKENLKDGKIKVRILTDDRGEQYYPPIASVELCAAEMAPPAAPETEPAPSPTE